MTDGKVLSGSHGPQQSLHPGLMRTHALSVPFLSRELPPAPDSGSLNRVNLNPPAKGGERILANTKQWVVFYTTQGPFSLSLTLGHQNARQEERPATSFLLEHHQEI